MQVPASDLVSPGARRPFVLSGSAVRTVMRRASRSTSRQRRPVSSSGPVCRAAATNILRRLLGTQADRWVAVALRTISPALDADASDEAWEWLCEGRICTNRGLLQMQPCTVSVTRADTRITWKIRPVPFLPLSHRQAPELPARAHDLKPSRPTESQLSLLVQGGSLRSPRMAWPPVGACASVSAPLQPGRRPCRAHSMQPPDVREEVRPGCRRSAPRLY